jgi:CubicO group peptidase (beta-lactamase class C family)
VGELKVEVDPAEVGLDPERLERIGRRFARYVDDGKLPGWLITVSRRGRLAYVASYGSRDLESGRPVEPDTLWRIYSMTKPITSVAAMLLWEEGGFELNDPVSRYIPAFGNVRVFTGGTDMRPVTVPATEPVRVWHLLTHTSA